MGDIGNDMLSGFLCQECGEVIDGEEPGYPRLCPACEDPAYRWDEDDG